MSCRVEGARADSIPHRYMQLDHLDQNFVDDQSAITALSLFLREDKVGNRSKYVFQIVDAKSDVVIFNNEQILAKIPRGGDYRR